MVNNGSNLSVELSKYVVIFAPQEKKNTVLLSAIENAGFLTRLVKKTSTLNKLLEGSKVSVLLLDVPGNRTSAISLIQAIKRKSNIPIIVLLEGEKLDDDILLLEIGVDLILHDPLNNREVVAHLRNLIRKASDQKLKYLPFTKDDDKSASTIEFHNWSIDTNIRELIHNSGIRIKLSISEFMILKILIFNKGEAVSRDSIFSHLNPLDRGMDPRSRNIDVLVSQLRKKLNLMGEDFQYITTIRNQGYIFEAVAVRYDK